MGFGSLMKSKEYCSLSKKCDTVKNVFGKRVHIVPSLRDQNGRRVMVYQFRNWDPDEHTFAEVFCNGFILGMLIAIEAKTQIAGVTVVCDSAGFTFKHLRNMALTDMKLLSMVVQVNKQTYQPPGAGFIF